MTQKVNISDDLTKDFNILMRSQSTETCEDPRIQQAALMFLKLGGRDLARQYLLISELCRHDKNPANGFYSESIRDTIASPPNAPAETSEFDSQSEDDDPEKPA